MALADLLCFINVLNERSSSAIGRDCKFKNLNWHVTLRCMIKAELIHFYNVMKKHVKSLQETIFFVPVECMVSTLLRPHSTVPTLIAYELHVLQYTRGYGVFEMLNVDQMKHWDSSGVQKNEIVFKINCKHHYNAQRITKASETSQKIK